MSWIKAVLEVTATSAQTMGRVDPAFLLELSWPEAEAGKSAGDGEMMARVFPHIIV